MKRALFKVLPLINFLILVGVGTSAFAQNYDWSGLYLGGQMGSQWLRSQSAESYPASGVPASKSLNNTNFVGGGQLGYNWQLSGIPVGLGVEADMTGVNHDKNGEIVRIGSDFINGRSELDVQGSIRGRFGWTIDRVLLYATSGVSFGAGKTSTTIGTDGFGSATLGKTSTLVGWTAGGGAEYALPYSSHWLLRVEYRYTDLGSIDLSSPGGLIGGAVSFAPYDAKADFRTHTIALGINYKF